MWIVLQERVYRTKTSDVVELKQRIKKQILLLTSCRRAAATICPRPGLQHKRAAAALSQAGRAGSDQPIRATQPAGRTRRPPTRCTRQTSDVRQTDVSQRHRLMSPGRGIIINRNHRSRTVSKIYSDICRETRILYTRCITPASVDGVITVRMSQRHYSYLFFAQTVLVVTPLGLRMTASPDGQKL